MKAISRVAAATLFGALASAPSAFAAEYGTDKEALAEQVAAAPVTLEQGLAASEAEGQPISGKFEIEEGNFQLSVYTKKDGEFREVLVDWRTGKIAKSEPLEEKEDIADAKAQSQLMAKARLPLRTAVEKAVAANPGFRAVSVVPSTEDGETIAAVGLVLKDKFMTERVKLD
jgi:hypothetical protein